MTNRPGPLARLRRLRRRRATAVRISVLLVLTALATTPWLARTSVDLAERRAALARFETLDPLLADWSSRLGAAAAGLGESAAVADRRAMIELLERALTAAPLDAATRERLALRLGVLSDAAGAGDAAATPGSGSGAGDDGLLRLGAALDRLALSESARDARRRALRLELSAAADRRHLAGIVDIALKGLVLALLLYVVWRAREWEG